MEEIKKYELELKELKKEYVKIRDTEYTNNDYKLTKMMIISERMNELHKKMSKCSSEKEKYNRATKKRADRKEIESEER